MGSKLFNLAKMFSTTVGTGSSLTLDSAVTGWLTFALAGAADGDVVDYAIFDGNDSEHGYMTLTSGSPWTGTRTVTKSTNGDARISMSGGAKVSISPRAETLQDASLFLTGTVAAARLGSGTASSSTALFGDSTFKTLAAIAQSGSASDLASGTVPTARLGSGTASSSTALFGDSTYKALAAIAQSGSASDLSAGTVPTARLGSGTASSSTALFGDQTYKTMAAIAQSGSASDLGSGTVPTARLGSGTASATTGLCGDQTWKAIGILANSQTWASAQTFTALSTHNGGIVIKHNMGSSFDPGLSASSVATYFVSDDGGPAGFAFHRSSAYAVNMWLDTSNNIKIGGWSDGSNLRMTLTSAGNVTFRGTGTFTGGVAIGGALTGGTTGAFSGNVTMNSSDERLKKNLRQIDDPVGRLMQLRAMLFEFNEMAQKLGVREDGTQFSLIAGDVKKALGDIGVSLAAIDLDPKTGKSKSGQDYLTWNVMPMITLLVATMQVLIQRMDAYEKAA